jgi:hypothetical protein
MQELRVRVEKPGPDVAGQARDTESQGREIYTR